VEHACVSLYYTCHSDHSISARYWPEGVCDRGVRLEKPNDYMLARICVGNTDENVRCQKMQTRSARILLGQDCTSIVAAPLTKRIS
jgi:hypothetical protein